jgi:hypothetical protein
MILKQIKKKKSKKLARKKLSKAIIIYSEEEDLELDFSAMVYNKDD